MANQLPSFVGIQLEDDEMVITGESLNAMLEEEMEEEEEDPEEDPKEDPEEDPKEEPEADQNEKPHDVPWIEEEWIDENNQPQRGIRVSLRHSDASLQEDPPVRHHSPIEEEVPRGGFSGSCLSPRIHEEINERVRRMMDDYRREEEIRSTRSNVGMDEAMEEDVPPTRPMANVETGEDPSLFRDVYPVENQRGSQEPTLQVNLIETSIEEAWSPETTRYAILTSLSNRSREAARKRRRYFQRFMPKRYRRSSSRNPDVDRSP